MDLKCRLFILLVICGTCWCQMDFPNYHPQWESTGEVWEGDCDQVRYNCPPDKYWDCWHPPFCPYHPIEVDIPDVGKVIGRSMVFWTNRFVNFFLGVPYAKPPVIERRFKPPEDLGPNWDLPFLREWDASFYRPACPQEIWELDQRFYEQRNTSEDCLYLNIFRPNITDRVRNDNYPVFVYVHGEEYARGDSQLYPGHILAKKDVVVVTFNYRLGALGFMSTLDEYAPGNYGLRDVIKVLEYIQRYISLFGGDPTKVTLVGGGSGAGVIGLLMVSPLADHPPYGKLFHRVILMSGSDLCDWSVVTPVWNVDAREYAKQLGREAGCDPYYGLSMEQMVDCLRYKSAEEIVNASAAITRAYGSLAGPFGPVVDGLSLSNTDYPEPVLLELPRDIRDPTINTRSPVMMVDILAGVTQDEGAYFVDDITQNMLGLNLDEGMDPGTFRGIITDMVRARSAVVRNVDDVIDAMEFEYTFWAKPDNKTAVLQNLVDLYSDMMYGWCVDAMLKKHAQVEDTFPIHHPTYMYVFNHRSTLEQMPTWMGVPHGKVEEYLFGFPFFNSTLGNLTNVVPTQLEWTVEDRNISDFVQQMWVNFTKYGIPTIEWTINNTYLDWYPFRLGNLSYLTINNHSFMEIDFRQNHYAFWREYFPTIAPLWPVTTTPGPTPRPRVELQVATWSMVFLSLITLLVIGALGITLWRRRRSPAERDYY